MMGNMMKKTILHKLLGTTVVLLCSGSAWSAGLQSLDDSALGQVDGQAGADISLELRLNHTAAGVFDTGVCASSKLEYCRLGIALNNRYHNGTQDTYDANGNRTPSATGRKQWLVLKGIQGTLNIQKIGFDGADIQYTAKNSTVTVKPAIQLTFDATKPILIRNFGFQSMSIETDTGANDVGPGYLDTTKYTVAANGAFDGNNPLTGVGREKGFLGLNMNGNLAVAGTIKMFSCEAGAAGHPRC